MYKEASITSLGDLLDFMEKAEEELETFDPAELVGTVKDKVDNIHRILEKMKSSSDYLKAVAKPLTNKARALDNAHSRLREYVAFHMKDKEFDTLPGNSYRVNLQYSKPTFDLNAEREPTALDAQLYKGFVRTEVSFSWDKEKIEEAFNEQKPIPGIVSASYKSTPFIKFYPYVPEGIETKKKGKK